MTAVTELWDHWLPLWLPGLYNSFQKDPFNSAVKAMGKTVLAPPPEQVQPRVPKVKCGELMLDLDMEHVASPLT